jgi:hypothetical protein
MMSQYELELERKLRTLEQGLSLYITRLLDHKILITELSKRVDTLENGKVENDTLIKLADSWEWQAIQLLSRRPIDELSQLSGRTYRNCAVQLLNTIREVK